MRAGKSKHKNALVERVLCSRSKVPRDVVGAESDGRIHWDVRPESASGPVHVGPGWTQLYFRLYSDEIRSYWRFSTKTVK